MERMIGKVTIEPDHWTPGKGILELEFPGTSGVSATVIRLTEDDLDQVALAIREHRLKTGPGSFCIIEVPAQNAGGVPARD